MATRTGFSLEWEFRRICARLAGVALALICAATAAEEPAPRRPLVSRPQVLTGAQVASDMSAIFPPVARAPMPSYLSFITPVAAATRNGVMYIVDAGLRQILRYDQARMSIARFGDAATGTATAIAIGTDLSLFVAEPGISQVLHYSWDGRELPAFREERSLRRPVGIALDEVRGQVFIADSLYNHVVVFSVTGRALDVLLPDEARSIESMVRGPEGLYLVDRLGQQVVVMALDGKDLYSFGNEVLKMPHAIAVDRFNRVYVSDDFDNTIKVFSDRELIATIGGSGATPANFNRITFLSLDQNTLYVADSLNGRIQSFQLAPVPARRPVAQ